MKRALCILAIVMTLAQTNDAIGGWGTGGCAVAQQAFGTLPAGASYEWRNASTGKGAGLFLNGVQVGWYDFADGAYNTFDAATGQFGPECEPPIKLPVNQNRNFGIDTSRVGKRERYSIGDKEVSRSECYAYAEKNLVDDAKWPKLTIAGGSEEQRKRILADAKAAGLDQRVCIQSYPANHWHLDGFKLDQDAKFQRSGFMMMLQDAGGVPVASVYEYAGPESLRQVDPNYIPGGGLALGVPWEFMALGGVAIVLTIAFLCLIAFSTKEGAK